MAIGITDEHRQLTEVVADLMERAGGRQSARTALETDGDELPGFWKDLREVGWLGLHLPEEYGGSGYGLAELVVVVEELARSVAAGPFLPTVLGGALLAEAGDTDLCRRWLPGLADGSALAGVAFDASLELRDGALHGVAEVVLGGGHASAVLLPVGTDVAVVEVAGDVQVTPVANLDPSRRAARIVLDGAPAVVLGGARTRLDDLAKLLLSADSVGISRGALEMAGAYAQTRVQFGRVIGTFQAVKHHCANMAVAAELATAAVWDAARTYDASGPGDAFAYGAALAATLALPAADLNAQLNTQVLGGIGMTWEHDAHLFLRRATVNEQLVDPEAAAERAVELYRAGARLTRAVALPPEAEQLRTEVRAFAERISPLDEDARRSAMVDEGYATPSWPKPWGREAGAVEQLVIEEEFGTAGLARPNYNITGWVILTLIQHATPEQVKRWVRPALDREIIWCQLFSEPDAGSDAAGIRTKGTKVEGGWLLNGQKVWTSGAHVAGFGFATVRTDPDAPKHRGITTMVIDMHAEGVTVRPLKMTSGRSEFNEVFFDDVFIPDADVVGPINGGWTVARATLGNESVSIGSGQGTASIPLPLIVEAYAAQPSKLTRTAARIGRHIARTEAADALNLRSVHRAVAGDGPGPEGAIAKLLQTENLSEASALLVAIAGPAGAYLDGPAALVGGLAISHRGMAIAGGTSEIKRNQIGERMVGLPRDPLIK